MPDVRLARNAERDLRRVGAGPQRKRIVAALIELGADSANLDIKALTGAKPWLRLRVGDYRILYWLRPDDVYEVGRIVHRRDLDASAASLPTVDARD